MLSLSIWGKQPLKKPVEGQENVDAYYFSSSEGAILSKDGEAIFATGFTSTEIETNDYVPLQVAQNKLKEVIDEYSTARESYKDNLNKVTLYYKDKLETTNAHYKGLLAEMKKNALRHVEIQKIMKKESEDTLNKNLTSTEKKVEELRDLLATHQLEAQEEERRSRHYQQESEQHVGWLTAEYEYLVISTTVQELVGKIEVDSMDTYYQGYYTNDEIIRHDCRNALNAVLCSIETNEMNDIAWKLFNAEQLGHSQQEELTAVTEVKAAQAAEVEALELRLEEEKAAVEESNREKTRQLKQKFSAVLKKSKDSMERCEVELCMEASILTPLSNVAYNELQQEVQASAMGHYQAQLATVKGTYEDRLKKAKLKYTRMLQEAEDAHHSTEVQLVMAALLICVVEENIPLVGGGGGGGGGGEGVATTLLTATTATTATSAATAAQAAASAAASAAMAQAQTDELLGQKKSLQESLDTINQQCDTLSFSLQDCNKIRDATKIEIKAWATKFKEENERDPDVQDKAVIKDKYQAYKRTTTQSKELSQELTELLDQKETLSKQLKDLADKLANVALTAAAAAAGEGAEQTPQDNLNLTPGYEAPSSKTVPADLTLTTSQAMEGRPGSASHLRSSSLLLRSPSFSSRAPASVGAVAIAVGVDGDVYTPLGKKEVAPVYERPEMVDQEVQSEEAALERLHLSAIKRSGNDASDVVIRELEEAHKEDSDAIDYLDDELRKTKADYEKMAEEYTHNQKEMGLVQHQLDEMISAKRTDVVKRMEEEVSSLRANVLKLEGDITTLEAFKKKDDIKLKEFRERVDAAEKDLKEKDEDEQKQLPEGDEKLKLKGKITDQRKEIIMKSQAATAGWNAAASADEELEKAVKKAYDEGHKEALETHQKDTLSLQEAVGEKELKVTKLLVDIGEMEHKLLIATETAQNAAVKMTKMQAEVAETIAGLTGGGGGGGDGGVSSEEADLLREELDAAQEELVGVVEKCEALQRQLEDARKKTSVYERLVAAIEAKGGGSKPSTAGTGKKGPGGSGQSSGESLPDIIKNIKKGIVKGTNLWKSDKRDECFDLYLEMADNAANAVHTATLKDTVVDTVNQLKANPGNKHKAAVQIRKALDRFLQEAQAPAVKKAEEEAYAAAATGIHSTASTSFLNQPSFTSAPTAADIPSLKEELSKIEADSREAAEAEGDADADADADVDAEGAAVTATATGATLAASSSAMASLLRRAQAAEKQVQSLRTQLSVVMSATAAAPALVRADTGGGGARTGRGAGAPSAAGGGGGGGGNLVEVRKLKQKVKELELEVKNGGGGGAKGAGGGGGSSQVTEKKVRELEAKQKKESKAQELKAAKMEKELAKTNETLGTTKKEKQKLVEEVKELTKLATSLEEFKEKAAQVGELQGTIKGLQGEMGLIAENFKKETFLRKKYKNELEDLKGAIRVYARMRPFAKYEIEKGCKQVVEIKDDTALKVVTTRGEKEFEFDAVFGSDSTQDEVFEDTKRLVESCLDGFNVCVFAYGQTGSGKTFTMTGSQSLPGLTPKAISELYGLIAAKPHLKCKVTTYFLELYNDQLVDLYWVLDNKNKKSKEKSKDGPPRLDIKMDNKNMVYVTNSVIKSVDDPAELFELFNKGNLERHTGATQMNAESSRSHSVFAIMVETYDTNSKKTSYGKLSLVDLAGSERADKTGAETERLKEAQSINKSLSALGDVISALSDGVKFIPYRNNKLTQLMQDSLGGNAKTLMFVNFSPADYNADETATSLTYAQRVKKIVNNAAKQAESEEVAKLKAIIKRLQAGQHVLLDPNEGHDEAPPPDDDGKVYDGY